MNSVFIAAALLVFIVGIQAQNANLTTLCPRAKCNGEGDECLTIPDSHTVTGCKSGLTCILNNGSVAGTCQRIAHLQESCSNTGCTDNTWDLTCYNGRCLYPGGVGPGEPCPSDTSDFFNSANPCLLTSETCGSQCGQVASSNCTPGFSGIPCGRGQYCHTRTATCTARVQEGGSCNSTQECSFETHCSSVGGTSGASCIKYFSRAAGSGCDSTFDCEKGTYCSTAGGSGVCTRATNDGQTCTVSVTSNSCPTDYTCVCRGSNENSEGRCRANVPSSRLVDDLRDLYECLNDNCPYDITGAHTYLRPAFVPGSCTARECKGQYRDLVNSGGDYNSGFEGSTCGAGNAVTVFVAFVLALVAFALLL